MVINNKIAVALIIGILICTSSFLINGEQLLHEILVFHTQYNAWDKILIYTFSYLICCISLALLFYIKNIWFAFILILVTSLTFFIEFIFKNVNGSQIGYDDFLMVINSSEHVFDVLLLFKKYIIIYVPILLLLIVFKIWIKNQAFLTVKKYLLILLVSFLPVYLIMKVSNGHRYSFPSLHKLVVLSLYANSNNLYTGKRDILTKKNISTHSEKHILLIVDESIRGDLLEINGGEYSNTPFLKSIMHQKIINFGVAYSGAVCSDYSNILLMSGIQLKDLPDLESKSRKLPQIFQYAKNAGYHTSYIDCQSLDNGPDGYMTYDDLTYIDSYIQVKPHFKKSSSFDTDRNALFFINKSLQNSRSFTYLVKYGCHFPFSNTYPENKQVFKPIEDITSWDRKNRKKILNSYNNAILWAVDGFWRKLDSIASSTPELVIIYTSDHGQNIFDHPEITATHCYKGPAPSIMAKVPLFIYSSDTTWVREMKLKIKQQNSPRSHFQIFPTIINLMGYTNNKDINLPYNSLFDNNSSAPNFYYTSGDIYGRSELHKNKIDNK